MSETTQGQINDIQTFLNSITEGIPQDTGERLKAERQALFEDIEKITGELPGNPDFLKTVLTKSADFPERSIGNVLLTAKYKPDATMLKTFNEWKEAGAWVKAGNSIKLLAKGKFYVDRNNKVQQSYAVRKYYDVSDTDMKRQPPAPKLKAGAYMQALGANPPCAFKFYNDMPLNALYVPELDTVCVKEHMKKQPEQCFVEIIGELSHRNQYLQDKPGYHRENADTVFKAQCTQYIVAARCGMDTGKIELPKELIPAAEPKALKGMLADIHRNAAAIYDRIAEKLPEIVKAQTPPEKKQAAKKPVRQEVPTL